MIHIIVVGGNPVKARFRGGGFSRIQCMVQVCIVVLRYGARDAPKVIRTDAVMSGILYA